MKILGAAIILFLFPISLIASDFTLNQGSVTNKGFLEVLPYESVRNLVVINIVIDGKTRRFLLDTGAPTIITASIQKTAHFQMMDRIPTFDINANTHDNSIVKIPSIGLGKLTITDVPALVVDNGNPVFQYLNIDGIIGSNLMRNMIVRISSNEKTVTFTDDATMLDLQNAYKDNMQTDKDIQSSPVVTVKIGNGITEELLFDTGYDGFYNMATQKFNLFKLQKDINVLGKETYAGSYGMFGEDEQKEQYKILIPEYSLGGYRFENVIAYTSSGNNSKLGAQLLTCGDVTLDYIHNKFYLQPYEPMKVQPSLQLSNNYYCGNN